MAQLIDLGKLRFDFKGEWDVYEEYEPNDVVKYGANVYVYTATTPSTSNAPTNTSFWTLMVEGLDFQGEYELSTNYKIGDIVSFGGKVYIATAANIGNSPGINTGNVWTQLVDGIQFEGEYDIYATYQAGDVVQYGANTYIANQLTTNNVPTDTTYWDEFISGIKYFGNYDSETKYEINEIVQYDGSVWICLQTSIGNTPESLSDYWEILVAGTFPSFEGSEGYFLSNDGTTVFWSSDLAVSSLAIEDGLYVGKEAKEFEENSELTNAVAVFRYDNDSEDEEFAQISFQNADPTSSTDFIAYPNNGHDEYGWLSVGVTGSDFADPLFPLTGNNDAYIFYDAPLKSTYSITNKALQGGVATLTLDSTPESSEVYVNAIVTVSDLGSPFDGTFSISEVDLENDTFSYETTGSNVSPEAASGTAVFNDVDADGNLVFATGDSGNENKIVFAAGGFASGNTQMEITPDVNVHIEIPTPSTSPSTGALTVVGGVGIQGDMNIQGDVNIAGQISFGGEGTIVATTNLAVSDPTVFVGANNLADNLDLGIIAEYAEDVVDQIRSVTNKSLTSNVVTLTTSTNHGYSIGDVVVITGVDSTFNGTYIITATPTLTTFSYNKTAANVSSAVVSPAGTATVTHERRYGGVVRDATDGVVKVFADTPTRPTTTVDFSQSGLVYAPFKAGAGDFSSLTTTNITTSGGTLNLGGTVNVTSAANFTGANVTLGSGIWSGTPTFNSAVIFSGTPSFTNGLTSAGNVTISGRLDVQEIREDFIDGTITSNVLTANYNLSNIFYIPTAPTANFTVNLTNAPTDNGKTFTIAVIVVQGATGYYPSTFQVGGTTPSGGTNGIRWVNNALPIPSNGAGRIDVYNFSLIRRSNAWIVLGSSTTNFQA